MWRREGHNVVLLVESGRDRSGAALWASIRFLCTLHSAILAERGSSYWKSGDRTGRSMRVWLGTMGLSIGGTTYKMVSEQAKRISGCRLQFFTDRNGQELMRHGGFVDGSISMAGMGGDSSAFGKIAFCLMRSSIVRFANIQCRSARAHFERSDHGQWRLIFIYGLPTGYMPSGMILKLAGPHFTISLVQASSSYANSEVISSNALSLLLRLTLMVGSRLASVVLYSITPAQQSRSYRLWSLVPLGRLRDQSVADQCSFLLARVV